MTIELRAQNVAKVLHCFFPGLEFHILKGQEDNRIPALLPLIFLSLGPDLLVPEVCCCILFADFKELPQHIHIQCFSEAAGSGKEGHRSALVDQLFDQQGLVNIVVFADGLSVLGDSDGQRLLCRGLSGRTVIRRLLCICGNHPGVTLLIGPLDSSLLAKNSDSALR